MIGFLLLISAVILLGYVLYAGIDESLSATYYKQGWKFQVALGLTGFLMMIYLLDITAGKWYQFLSFFATSALIFVAFAPDYKQMLEGKVHAVSAYVSAGSSVLLLVLMGFWYIPAITLTLAMKPVNNRTYWLEMGCFSAIYITLLILKIWY